MNIEDLIEPIDEHNKKLISNVHPIDWENPTPKGKYNLVVIGAGTAGLVTAAGAAAVGAKVALVERHLMGGDCLNVGCVPSKAVISSASVLAQAKRGEDYGLNVSSELTSDFSKVWERMRRLRAKISPHDSVKRFSDLGIDVYLGDGVFKSESTVEVAGSELRFSRAVIATGARAVKPSIEGLEETGYLDNSSVFNITKQPETLAILGGGPIGCELAQTFQRLGTEVTILDRKEQFLSKEDPDAVRILAEQFDREGVEKQLGVTVKKVRIEGNKKIIEFDRDQVSNELVVDEIFVAAGRTANVESLGLEAAGVETDEHGVVVNDYMQTSNPNIYAAGDVCLKWKFTHAADFAARIVIRNALFSLGPFGKERVSDLTIPWCTYTEPEIAHVGISEKEAGKKGIEIETYIKHLSEVDRAILRGEDSGFVKIHVKKGSDKILGATIVGRNAGDMISEISMAISNDIGLGKIAKVIHPYPTVAEAIRQTGDLYNKTKLTPNVKRMLSFILKLRR